jgi:hypothetical protein
VKPAAAAAVDALAGEAEALAVVEAALKRRHAHKLKALALDCFLSILDSVLAV